MNIWNLNDNQIILFYRLAILPYNAPLQKDMCLSLKRCWKMVSVSTIKMKWYESRYFPINSSNSLYSYFFEILIWNVHFSNLSTVILPYTNHLGKDSVKVLAFYVRQKQTLTSKIEVVLHHSIYAVKMVIMKHAEFFYLPDVNQISRIMWVHLSFIFFNLFIFLKNFQKYIKRLILHFSFIL